MRSLLILPVTVALGLLTFAFAVIHPATETALALCANQGRSVAECRLVVLGR